MGLVAPRHVGSSWTRAQTRRTSPALAGRFLTTAPPGKSLSVSTLKTPWIHSQGPVGALMAPHLPLRFQPSFALWRALAGAGVPSSHLWAWLLPRWAVSSQAFADRSSRACWPLFSGTRPCVPRMLPRAQPGAHSARWPGDSHDGVPGSVGLQSLQGPCPRCLMSGDVSCSVTKFFSFLSCDLFLLSYLGPKPNCTLPCFFS